MNSAVVDANPRKERQTFNKRFGIFFNGRGNIKPFLIESLFDHSPSAHQCGWIYETFLGGAGFKVDMDENISARFWEHLTPNDLLFAVAESVSRHQGAFVHVRYNALYEKIGYDLIPYSLCRVGNRDSEDYHGKIIVAPKGWGSRVKKDEVTVFHTYNPKPEVIQAQVDAAGGWAYYTGQVAFLRMDKKGVYPKPLIDPVSVYAEVEIQMGKFYAGLVRRRFEDVDIIRYRKFDTESKYNDFVDNVKKVSGLDATSSKLLLQDEWDDEREKSGNFKFDKLTSDAKPERYEHIERVATNQIRRVFRNIPPQLIDFIQGKLGNTSGEDLLKAQSVYNASIGKDKKKVSTFMKDLFTNYTKNINPADDWSIAEYKLMDDGTTNQ